MPDPLVYLRAIVGSALASMLVVLAARKLLRVERVKAAHLDEVLALGVGLIVGCVLLPWRPAWPPLSGLDRFVTIVLPLALGVELVAGFPQVSRRHAWILRICLAAATPQILLHGSVYLSGGDDGWTSWQAIAVMSLSAVMPAAIWILLSSLNEQSGGASVPLTLAMAIPSGGLAIMLAGYINGGAIAFPLAATILGTTLAIRLIAGRSTGAATLGLGMVALVGLLIIGRFFGRLTTGFALIILLAPLLGWVSELPLLRHRRHWQIGTVRLVLVAITLACVLIAARRIFDREMAPLLGTNNYASDCRRAMQAFLEL